ncbi:DUF2075 domain-containing protein [Spirillospora sp. NPDC029432]|uniref:DUF2075 domain-containing protein n=1 Tax=Spirillospora sp. NPDC029432 TaxID=3154599 RepID=UPI003452C862
MGVVLLAFRRTAEALLSPVEARFAHVLREEMKMQGTSVSDSEFRSWERSVPVVARDLVEAGLGQVEMLIEYKLPMTSKRADVVLAGVDRRTGGDAFVVVELKQWSRVEVWEDNPSRVVVHNMTGKPKLHPALQARGYTDYIYGFLTELANAPDALHAVAYLHNADRGDVIDLYDAVEDARTQLFTQTTRGAFVEYLQDKFAPLPGRKAADRFLNSEVRPSRKLLRHAMEEIRNRDQFTLIAEQRLAYQLVLDAVGKSRRSDLKTVVVITGGPGSGKSVITLSLLGELAQRGHSVLHATGSKSFTQTMRRHVAGGGQTAELFKYFNHFTRAEKNGLDALICDEAHRIRRVSNNASSPGRGQRLQIDELIDAARVPVFLLDGQQNVRPGEMGTLRRIREHAAARGLNVEHVPLDEQFRCGGSRRYEDWMRKLLGLHPDPPERWMGDDDYEVTVVDSPAELESALRHHHENGRTARMTAGFCWPWSNARKNPRTGRPELVPDVRIGEWERPWNVKDNQGVGDAPPSDLWATHPGGFGQVGCVFTAQGFEYDWNGVIVGPDLVYRDGKLVTVRGESRDPALLSPEVSDQEADVLIRNTYKVLLTRGMMGTLLYSVDERTQQFLAKLQR